MKNVKTIPLKKCRCIKTKNRKIYDNVKIELLDGYQSIIGYIVFKSKTTQPMRVSHPVKFGEVVADLLQEGNLAALQWQSENSNKLENYKNSKNFTLLENLVFESKYKYIRNYINRYIYNNVYSKNPAVKQLIQLENQYFIEMQVKTDIDVASENLNIAMLFNELTEREKIVANAMMQGLNYQQALRDAGYSNLNSKALARLKNKVQKFMFE